MIWFLIALALVFAFLNGYRDATSIIAGVVASRALPPRLALTLSGLAEFIAPFIFGVAVARTLTTGLVDPQAVTITTITIAMMSALAWTLFTWVRGIPSSSSHALVGGLLGAVIVVDGPQGIIASGLIKVLVPLFLAPPIGMAVGYLVMILILAAFQNARPSINNLFRQLQMATMIGLALSHSSNDAQKSMGIITLGLLLAGRIPTFKVPLYVIGLCAAAIAIGASQGDWRLLRTLGGKMYPIRPVNALASQTASALVIMVSSIVGAPVSTSQVISMSLLGSGAAERVNKVRWQIGVEMLWTWVLTIPATMTLAALMFAFVRLIART